MKATKAEQHPWAMLVTLSIGFFVVVLDSTIVAVVQPVIQTDMGTDINGAVWVSSGYLLGYVAPMLPAARLGDRVGPKQLYVVGLSLFTAASLGCALAWSIESLVAARVVQGIGAALLAPQTMTLINRVFPKDSLGAAMGTWGAILGVASMAGPLVGGLITQFADWRWIFVVNLPIGVIGVLAATRYVPRLPVIATRPFSILSIAISMTAVTLIVGGIQQGERYDWAPWSLACLACGVLAMVVFARRETAANAHALLPRKVFAHRNFTIACAVAICLGASVSTLIIPPMFYLQAARGMSALNAALVWMPMMVVAIGVSPFVGRLVDRVHPRAILVPGFTAFATAVACFAWGAIVEAPGWVFYAAAALAGIGSACTFGPLSATATRRLPDELIATGSGVYNTVRQFGAVLGSAAIGALMQNRVTALAPNTSFAPNSEGASPDGVGTDVSAAMGQSMVLPVVLLVSAAALCCALRRETGKLWRRDKIDCDGEHQTTRGN